MIKAVVFDNDGVLMSRNLHASISEFTSRAQIRRNVPEVIAELKKTENYLSDKDFAKMAGNASITRSGAKKMYEECYQNNSVVNDNMISLVRLLKKDYRVYVLTNTNALHFSANKQKGTFKEFHTVFTSFEIGYRKPDKRIYSHLLNEIKLNPSEVIFIDNKEENVSMASVLGIHGIHFTGYRDLVHSLESKGVLKKSFNEQCYELLRKVPRGKVTTYGAIAKALGTKAYRAVGNAMNKNPYAPQVPCHRVVGTDGSLTGFAQGTAKKTKMLTAEGVPVIDGKVDLARYMHKFS